MSKKFKRSEILGKIMELKNTMNEIKMQYEAINGIFDIAENFVNIETGDLKAYIGSALAIALGE